MNNEIKAIYYNFFTIGYLIMANTIEPIRIDFSKIISIKGTNIYFDFDKVKNIVNKYKV